MRGIEMLLFGSIHYLLNTHYNLSTRFIKKYLIRDDVESTLALKLQRVTIDDHMARLYGPTVVAKSQVEK